MRLGLNNCFMVADCGGGGRRDNDATAAARKAAENLDTVTSKSGDTSTTRNTNYLNQQVTSYISDSQKQAEAMKRIREAQAEGKSVFETLIDIANDNNINTADFLSSCGFKSPEELHNDENVQQALAEWVTAKIDMDNLLTQKEGKECFVNVEGVYTSSEVYGSAATMYAYMNDLDAVFADGVSYFCDDEYARCDDEGKYKGELSIYSLDNIMEWLFDDLSDNFTEKDLDISQRAYDLLRTTSYGTNLINAKIQDEYSRELPQEQLNYIAREIVSKYITDGDMNQYIQDKYRGRFREWK